MGSICRFIDALIHTGQNCHAAELGLCDRDALAGNQTAEFFGRGEVQLVLMQHHIAVWVKQEGAIDKALAGLDDHAACQNVYRGFDGKQREKVKITFQQRLGKIFAVKMQDFFHSFPVLIDQVLRELVAQIKDGRRA